MIQGNQRPFITKDLWKEIMNGLALRNKESMSNNAEMTRLHMKNIETKEIPLLVYLEKVKDNISKNTYHTTHQILQTILLNKTPSYEDKIILVDKREVVS